MNSIPGTIQGARGGVISLYLESPVVRTLGGMGGARGAWLSSCSQGPQEGAVRRRLQELWHAGREDGCLLCLFFQNYFHAEIDAL